jgi:hypothetical protein
MPLPRGFTWPDAKFIFENRPNHKNRAVNLHTIMINRGKRNISFIVACLFLIFTQLAKGQTYSASRDNSLPNDLLSKKMLRLNPVFDPGQGRLLAPHTTGIEAGFPDSRQPIPAKIPMQVISAEYYTDHFGFMCKKEWQFEKSFHLPLRVRLGSLEYCNYLEGKK